jgi:hypothetical protein
MYSSGQELLLHGRMIPWRGRLRFRTYNLPKLQSMEYSFECSVKQKQASFLIWKYVQHRVRNWLTQYCEYSKTV